MLKKILYIFLIIFSPLYISKLMLINAMEINFEVIQVFNISIDQIAYEIDKITGYLSDNYGKSEYKEYTADLIRIKRLRLVILKAINNSGDRLLINVIYGDIKSFLKTLDMYHGDFLISLFRQTLNSILRKIIEIRCPVLDTVDKYICEKTLDQLFVKLFIYNIDLFNTFITFLQTNNNLQQFYDQNCRRAVNLSVDETISKLMLEENYSGLLEVLENFDDFILEQKLFNNIYKTVNNEKASLLDIWFRFIMKSENTEFETFFETFFFGLIEKPVVDINIIKLLIKNIDIRKARILKIPTNLRAPGYLEKFLRLEREILIIYNRRRLIELINDSSNIYPQVNCSVNCSIDNIETNLENLTDNNICGINQISWANTNNTYDLEQTSPINIDNICHLGQSNKVNNDNNICNFEHANETISETDLLAFGEKTEANKLRLLLIKYHAKELAKLTCNINDYKDHTGQNPFHYAIMSEDKDILKILLSFLPNQLNDPDTINSTDENNISDKNIEDKADLSLLSHSYNNDDQKSPICLAAGDIHKLALVQSLFLEIFPELDNPNIKIYNSSQV